MRDRDVSYLTIVLGSHVCDGCLSHRYCFPVQRIKPTIVSQSEWYCTKCFSRLNRADYNIAFEVLESDPLELSNGGA